MRIKRFLACLVLMFVVIKSGIAAAPASQCIDCSSEINNLSIRLSELQQEFDLLNKSLANMTLERDYYKNLSEYYRFLYESKEVNVTNRELINIYNTLNLFKSDLNITNTKVDQIDERLTVFSFQFGLSILSLTGISVAIIEATIHWRRRRRRNDVAPNFG